MFNKLKLFQNSRKFQKNIVDITEESNKLKLKVIDNSLQYEEKHALLSQQKSALKKQLVSLDLEYNELKAKLDKEVKSRSISLKLIFFARIFTRFASWDVI